MYVLCRRVLSWTCVMGWLMSCGGMAVERLGGFCFRGAERPLSVLEALNGRVCDGSELIEKSDIEPHDQRALRMLRWGRNRCCWIASRRIFACCLNHGSKSVSIGTVDAPLSGLSPKKASSLVGPHRKSILHTECIALSSFVLAIPKDLVEA